MPSIERAATYYKSLIKLPTWYGPERARFAAAYADGIEKVVRAVQRSELVRAIRWNSPGLAQCYCVSCAKMARIRKDPRLLQTDLRWPQNNERQLIVSLSVKGVVQGVAFDPLSRDLPRATA